MSGERLELLGDTCVSIELGTGIDPGINARCVALGADLERLALTGVRDIVPTYNAVTVHFDPGAIDRNVLCAEIMALAAAAATSAPAATRVVEVPVSYGGDAGPDLAAVAAFARCDEAEVVRLHTAVPYQVYMLGFLPGFPYMGPVDSRIAMPRLDAPRAHVAAGSVGIAGLQTGIYPCESPGGWRIIGKTAVRLFDAERPEPFLLKAGDRVKFVVA